MKSTSVAVQLQDVSVVLGGHFQALKGLDMTVDTGQITGFIGPSGAGKTTLIRAIVGRQQINGGTVTVFGRPAGAASLRSQQSYMTQEVSIYDDLTVGENVRYFAAMHGLRGTAAKQALHEVLAAVHLQDKANSLVSNLSGGQKQRASLAIALLGRPKLLVLDEPTVGLDPVLREQLWQLFHQLCDQGTTIIISSHVMDEAERCDYLALIRDGQVVAQGTPVKLKQQTGTDTIEASFLQLVGADHERV